MFQQPIVQLFRDGVPLVVHVIDVPTPRVSDPHDRPQGFRFTFPFVGFGFGISHLAVVLFEDVFDLFEPFWWRFRTTEGQEREWSEGERVSRLGMVGRGGRRAKGSLGLDFGHVRG